MSKESQKEKNNVFLIAFNYIKSNLAIGYSFALLLLVPLAFFANNYLINSDYLATIDQITLKKATLAENILNPPVYERFSDPAALQSLIGQVARDYSDEIISLSILKPRDGQSGYEVIASSDLSAIGQERPQDQQIFLALNNPNAAFLDEDRRGRFWKVIKAVHGGENDEKIGLMEMSLSLAEADATTNSAITRSYVILAVIVLVLVLLLANQIRLLDYALSLNKLREVDKMKDMFISMASHELRSPLTAIKGYLDLLKGKTGASLDEEGNRYLQNISVSVDRLGSLVEDVLEVSRIEGNRLPMEIMVIDPSAAIAASIEEMRAPAMEKNLALTLQPSPKPGLIEADESRLKQVLVNFISNAVKYTKSGSITVSAAVKEGRFAITVADTGIGMSSEEQANLFQKFYRVKNENTKNIVGTGLGLWITTEIVRRMRGKITVESIPGVGSHFTVYFPLAKKQPIAITSVNIKPKSGAG